MNFELYLGDCLDLMKSIPDQSIDAIICDLPYGTTQCKWDSVIPFDALWSHYKRIAKPNAAIVLTSMQPFTSALIMSNPSMFKYDWVWEKGSATGFLNAKKQPLRAHESVCVFYKNQCTYNPQFTHGHERKIATKKTINSECYGKAIKVTDYDSTDRYPRSVQFFSSDKQKSNLHPTQKPVKLYDWLLSNYAKPEFKIIDTHLGSGSHAISAHYFGISEFVGCELDEDYFKKSVERIKIETAQEALF